MAAWLESLPRFILAMLVVVGTVVFLYVSDPPQSICDTQLAAVDKYLQEYFFNARETGFSYQMSIKDKYALCLRSNSLGGCADFFERLNKLEKQLRKIPPTCSSHPKIKDIKTWHFNGINIMARLAWGEQKPEFPDERKGWLDERSVALFCRLKKEAVRLHGAETLGAWRIETHKKIQASWVDANCVRVCQAEGLAKPLPIDEKRKKECGVITADSRLKECLCGHILDNKMRTQCLCELAVTESDKANCRCQIKCAEKETREEVIRKLTSALPAAEIEANSLFSVSCQPYF